MKYRFILLVVATFLPCSVLAREVAKIQQAATLPKTTPWDLEALSKPPAFEWSDGEQVRSLFYAGEKYKGKPTRVFAYCATPGTLAGDKSKDKNLPAIVLVHGGGGTAFERWARLWASRGYAAIAMDLAGCGPKRKRLPDGGPGQHDDTKFGAIGGPVTDQWTYHAVANVIRAHSLIRSFPEVDADRTAITGISWGGYLTCIVAGLDDRFKAAVPVYGCGFLHENSVWLSRFAAMSPENRAKWIRLWDPSQYVGSAKMPMLFVNGGDDFAYPPDSHAKTYKLVKSPKHLHFVPNLRHGHIFDKPKAVEVYVDSMLRGGTALAKIGSLSIKGDAIQAEVDAKVKTDSMALHYTTQPLPGNPKTRKWTTKPGKIEGSKVFVDAPPADATIWFVTVRDQRGTTVSSMLYFPMVQSPSE
ncbi:MAG: acetylxylan esterase [Pirellulales bacterium]|nr:acetylxylan esterase [Pirellulales bacterium]